MSPASRFMARPAHAAPSASRRRRRPGSSRVRRSAPICGAFALYLRFTHAISFERLSHLFCDLLGIDISEGALVNICDDSRPAFARQASLIRSKLLAGTILASDETTMWVGKKNWSAWVFHHTDSACFVIHPNRSRATVEGFLGNRRPDFWISDRLASQMGWATKDHQVCLAHLIREASTPSMPATPPSRPTCASCSQRACAAAGRRAQLADATLRSYAKLDVALDNLMRTTRPMRPAKSFSTPSRAADGALQAIRLTLIGTSLPDPATRLSG
jgi:hypothetical protein